MNVRNFSPIKEFLFENKKVSQTIFKNTFWLTLGTGINRLLMFILLVYVARILGATEYGKFTFALAFISLFVVFHDFGLSRIITREFAREKEKKEEFSSILSLKFLLSLIALILILIGSLFITSDPLVQKIILVLALFSLINGFINAFHSYFQARQQMQYEAWVETLQALLITGFGLFVLFKIPSVESLSYAYLFASLIALIFALILFQIKFFHLKIVFQSSVWKKFLKMSWPLALSGLFGALYTYIDSVMMGYWGMITETGWYNAAYRIIIISLIPMGLISASFYPVLSNFFKQSKEKLQNVWNNQMEIMILSGIPLMVGGIVLAPRIIYSLYPSGFTASILAFQILIIMAGLIFFYRPFVDVMIASNQQKKIFLITFFGALFNIILNLILIPKYSLYGAAGATVITYLLILLIYFRYTMKFTSISPFKLKFLLAFGFALISSALMYFVIIQPVIYNLNVLLSVIIGAATYLSALFVLKSISKHYSRIKAKL